MTNDASASFSQHSTVRAWALAALLALLTPNAMLTQLGPPDDRSVFAYIGWLMHRGYRPYVDLWDHKGPLLYWLNWLGWCMTPRTTIGIGVLQALVTFGAFACLFLVIRRFVSAGVLLLSAIFSLALLAQSGEGGNMAETWALLPLAAVHVVVYRCAVSKWRSSDALVLGTAFAACFAIRPNLCIEPAIAILLVLHFVRLESGFRFAFTALFLVGVIAALELGLLLGPVWAIGAGKAFVQEYFGYNAAYSRFVPFREHMAGILELLGVMRTMALLYAAAAGWLLLLARRFWGPQAFSYQLFLLFALPAELVSAALSGRAFYHYLVPLLPSATVLCAIFLQWLFARWSRARFLVRVAVAVVLVLAVALQIRKYWIFVQMVLMPHQPETAVARFVDRVTAPSDRVLPVGDVGSDTIALQARREPASRFIYQLPLVHRANPDAAQQEHEFLEQIEAHPPAVIFSTPGPVGNICDVPSPTEQADKAQALRNGYSYGELGNELAPLLRSEYRRVTEPRFRDVCVFLRKDLKAARRG